MGKGGCHWEEGRFETPSLNEGHEAGVWVQDGNDREGGSELMFSHDSPIAQGEGW